MSTPQGPHVGRVLGGQYRVESLLGYGGMGAVYRGVQLSVQRAVAIKLIGTGTPNPEQTYERFRREAEATARLNHPNTVRLFDFGVTETHELYMVMELLEGCDLAARLAQGPLPLREALAIVRQVLAALSEAHALGIIHRDLKPGNVFLSRVHGGDSFVKVMDFGIAGIAPGHDAKRITVTGAVMGTPAYMSPEQAQGKPVDARSDLYSIGVMLFEMLTGKPPFEADTLVSMLLAHVTLPPKRLAEAGAQFPELPVVQALLDRLLAKPPDERPSSATELSQQIDALLAGGQAQTLPAPQAPPLAATQAAPSQPLTPLHWDASQTPPRRRRGLLPVLGLCALAALGTAAALWLPRAPGVRQPSAPSGAPPAAQLGAAPSATVTAEPSDVTGDDRAATPSSAEPQPPTAASTRTGSVRPALTSPASGATEPSVAAPSPSTGRDGTREAADGSGVARDATDPGAAADPASVSHGAAQAPSERTASKSRADVEARARSRRERREHRLQRGASAEPELEPATTRSDSRPVVSIHPDAPGPRPDLNRAPPYPSASAAKRAYDGGKINAAAYEAALSLLKARRAQRIALERENLEKGQISPQEYEWRLGRIDAEYRGD